MYIGTTTVQKEAADFQIRDGFHLDENNRWIILNPVHLENWSFKFD